MIELPVVLSTEEMKNRYGDFYGRRPKSGLDKSRVPKVFWPLIPYAEFWGILDDSERAALVDQAPDAVKSNLKEVVSVFDSSLDEWLAGQEADSPKPSDEYVAFSTMRMAAYRV